MRYTIILGFSSLKRKHILLTPPILKHNEDDRIEARCASVRKYINAIKISSTAKRIEQSSASAKTFRIHQYNFLSYWPIDHHFF